MTGRPPHVGGTGQPAPAHRSVGTRPPRRVTGAGNALACGLSYGPVPLAFQIPPWTMTTVVPWGGRRDPHVWTRSGVDPHAVVRLGSATSGMRRPVPGAVRRVAVTWLTAFLDTRARGGGRRPEAYCARLRHGLAAVGTSGRGRVRQLQPPDGDAPLKVARWDGTPRRTVYLDVHTDAVEAVVDPTRRGWAPRVGDDRPGGVRGADRRRGFPPPPPPRGWCSASSRRPLR